MESTYKMTYTFAALAVVSALLAVECQYMPGMMAMMPYDRYPQGYCTHHQTGELPDGGIKYLPGCKRAKCNAQAGKVTISSCGVMDDNCGIIMGNSTGQYPQCCPRYIACSDSDFGETRRHRNRPLQNHYYNDFGDRFSDGPRRYRPHPLDVQGFPSLPGDIPFEDDPRRIFL